MHTLEKLLLTSVFVFTLGLSQVRAQEVDATRLYEQMWQGYEQAMQQGKHQAAVASLEKLTQLGDPRAMFFLGTHYSLGQGVAKNLATSFAYFKKAAAAGDEEAKFMLGVAYWQGNGVEKDLRRAHKIFKQLADNNHPGAQYHLALLYGKGIGVKKDLATARVWLHKSAANGYPAAVKHLQRNSVE